MATLDLIEDTPSCIEKSGLYIAEPATNILAPDS